MAVENPWNLDRINQAALPLDGVFVTCHGAALAEGTTILENCAREPEVVDLAQCLLAMGARIEGIGSDRLVVHGCERNC